MPVSIFAIAFVAAVKDISSIVPLGSGANKPLSLFMLSYFRSGEMQPAAIIGVILSGPGVIVALRRGALACSWEQKVTEFGQRKVSMPVRKKVKIAGDQGHRNPIPTCVTLGNLILPSVISGISGLPEGVKLGPQEEIERGFQRMKEIVEAAGGSVDTIGKITVYLRDFSHREFVNVSWLKMFPDEENRPARHVIPMSAELPGRAYMQLDVFATTK